MLLEEKKVSVISSGMKDTVDFTAKLDGLMFDNLINGIYSNKMGAGIREYSTNARDGHARRGNLDKPFDIGLPTRANPIFEVRDYGSSLSHREVFEVFTVLGESTKRDTNEETGCLGLGSKSAFAYTNTFNVTCWLHDEERNYVCYIGEAGKPKTSLVSTTPSKEERGMRVSYAVKLEDVGGFNKEASRQLRGFEPQPNVIRKTEDYRAIDNANLLMEGDGWKIFATEKSKSFGYEVGKSWAIQGSVAYPIDLNDPSMARRIRKLDSDRSTDLRGKVERLLTGTDCLIKFNIGEITMTTSREELQYNDMTCDNIVSKAVEVIGKVEEDLNKAYENCKSLKEARMLYSRVNTDKNVNNWSRSIDSILNINERHWKGEVISRRMIIRETPDEVIGECTKRGNYYNKTQGVMSSETVDGQVRLESDSYYQDKFGTMKTSFNFRHRDNKNAKFDFVLPCDEVGEKKVFVEVADELETAGIKNVTKQIRYFWKNTMVGEENFIWVKVKTLEDAKKFLKGIYHDKPSNVTWAHTAKKQELAKAISINGKSVKPNTLVKKMRVIYGDNYAYTSESNKYRVIDFSVAPQVMPVVYSLSNNFYWTEKEMLAEEEPMSYKQVCRTICEWVGRQTAIFVINQTTLSFAKDNPQWTESAKDFMIKEWKTKTKGWEQLVVTGDDNKSANEEYTLHCKLQGLWKKETVVPKGLTLIVKDSPNRDDYSSRTNIPMDLSKWMKNDVERLQKLAKTSASKTPVIDYLEKDPILHYLTKEYNTYHNSELLITAIKQHIADKHT